jgi:YbbR domain-containing protein
MSFRQSLLENWTLKLTAILLAFVLWLMVRGDPNAERVLSVPLEVRVPRNMEITSERPATVDVTVRGAFSNMWFAPAFPTYIIDMQDLGEGEHVVQLSPGNVRFPRASGLEAIAVRPVRLKLTLERSIAKEVPVQVVTQGEPEPESDIYEISVSPASVILSGPRSRIERMHEIRTEAIPVTGHRTSMREFANLDLRDDAVHSAPPGPVEVNIELGPHRALRRVTGVRVVPDDRNATVTPQYISLQVLVPVTMEKTLTAEDFTASVLVSQLLPTQLSATLKPEVRLKSGTNPAVLIKAINPATVLVRRNKTS